MAFLDETGLADFWNHILARLNNFVPAEAGKGLSSNDYTTAEKEKLAGIANSANNYTLPVATASKIGGVKSGTDITIDSDGIMHISNGAVSRVKLNTDALYSPLVNLSNASYTLTSNDIGKTIQTDYSLLSSDINIILTQDNSANIAVGAEIAFCHIFCNSMTITPSGVRFAMVGQEDLITTGVKISQKYGMAAIKKLYTDPTYGDLWLVQGLVESV